MTDPDLERLTADYLEGTLDEEGRRRLEDLLERDAAARSEFVDHLQLHHRLGRTLRPGTDGEGKAFAASVVRRLGFEKEGRRFAERVVGRLRGPRPGLRYLPLAAAAALLVGLAVLLVSEPEPVPGPAPAASRGRVLFVVKQVPLAEGDDAVRRRLERLGFAVAAVPAFQLRAGDASGCAFVAVSSTARAEQLSAAPVEGMLSLLRDLPVPLLVWEPRLFSDLGLSSGTIHGEDWAASQHPGRLDMVDSGHPLAAGYSGAVRVTSGRARLSWGRLAPGVRSIAVLEGEPRRTAILAADAGDVLEGGARAPARRVGLFLFESAVPGLTPEGWRLFDAAALWCAGDPG